MRHRKYSDQDAINAIRSSSSFMQIFRKLGLVACTGGNYSTIRRIIKKHNIDISHMKGQAWAKGLEKTDLKNILVQNSRYANHRFKKRIIKNGLLENKCKICGLSPEWQGKILTLQLDHINGDKTDSRIENLRLLCPNCHSQTPNFCRIKEIKSDSVAQLTEAFGLGPNCCGFKSHPSYQIKQNTVCKVCNKEFYSKHKQKFCSQDCSHKSQRKTNRPSREELQELIKVQPWSSIAKKYEVSDKAVVKWAKLYGIYNRKQKVRKIG